jgi:hypothetical protein
MKCPAMLHLVVEDTRPDGFGRNQRALVAAVAADAHGVVGSFHCSTGLNSTVESFVADLRTRTQTQTQVAGGSPKKG